MSTYGLNSETVGFNEQGGYMSKMINKTGKPSVKGNIVKASEAQDFAFELTSIEDKQAAGIVYDDGIPDGELCFIVKHGPAQVLLVDNTTATRGFWAYMSKIKGRCLCDLKQPPGSGIKQLEARILGIGFGIENKDAGINVLAWIDTHFK
jgi:hypothetical protein